MCRENKMNNTYEHKQSESKLRLYRKQNATFNHQIGYSPMKKFPFLLVDSLNSYQVGWTESLWSNGKLNFYANNIFYKKHFEL